MPRSVVDLYRVATITMLDRIERKDRADKQQSKSMVPIPQLRKLLEAAFFQTYAAERRIIRLGDPFPRRLCLANPEELKSIQLRTVVGDERAEAVALACRNLPAPRQDEINSMCERVRQDLLLLLSLLSIMPTEMQSSHLSFQEYFAAQAIGNGMKLPPEAAKPWCWSPWWGNTLRLGNEIEKDFETLLLSASAEAGSTTLNLSARASAAIVPPRSPPSGCCCARSWPSTCATAA